MKVTILFTGLCLSFFNMHSKAQNHISVKVGKKIHAVNNSLSTITQTSMGQEMIAKSDVTIDIDVEVKQTIPDILLSLKISRLQLKTDVLGKKSDFDSDKSEDRNEQIGQVLAPVIGKSFDILLNTASELNKVASSSDQSTEAAKSLLQNFDKLPRELMLAMPATINKGDTWSEYNTTDEENKVRIDYNVVSLTNTMSTLLFKGIAISKANKIVQGMDALVTSSSNFVGELIVDIKSGIIKTKKSTIETKGTTEIIGHCLPFTIKSTMTTNSK